MDKPEVFTADDLDRIRKGLAAFRSPGAYEPGRWMVSKYTRDKSVVGDTLPEQVRIRDITLRVAEQIAGIAISAEDRLRLLKALAAAGIASIQPSAFRRGHDVEFMRREAEAVREINPTCELVYGAVSSSAEIEMAAEAGYDSVDVWSTFMGDAAPSCAGAVYHRAWQDRDWHDLRFPKTPEDQVARSVKFIEVAKEHGIEIGGTVNLLSICDASYVDLYCRSVAAAGCRQIVLADGAGGASPEVFGHMVRVARAAAPECVIGVHAHNNFGLALPSVVESLKAGATLVEVSLNGYEEHPGNPDLSVTVAALEALYGVNTGVDITHLWSLARLGEEITGLQLELNHPVVGRAIYAGGGGDEYVQEHHVDPLIHASLTAEAVGGERTVEIGVTTGPFTLWDKLVELGIGVDGKEFVEEALRECKARLQAGARNLTDADLHDITDRVRSRCEEEAKQDA